MLEMLEMMGDAGDTGDELIKLISTYGKFITNSLVLMGNSRSLEMMGDGRG